MKYCYYILSVSLLILIFSCDDKVDLEQFIDDSEELTLVYSSISPQDTILKVRVLKTLSSDNNIEINNSDAFVIPNAVITLSDATNNSVRLSYNSDDKNYQIEATQLEILPGATYFLSVMVDQREFTSSCTIPNNAVTELAFELTDNLNNAGDLKESVTIRFLDIPEASNNYIVGARIEDDAFDLFLDFENRRFITDQIEDGALLASFGFFNNNPDSVTDITLQVANVEPILYDSLFASYSNKENRQNPFYEVIIPPNNIEGENAYGVFAGFQITERLITYQ
ncbi:DUF4249 domain-containing protein [Aquimarina sp. ERC-38]|uniref:hypothetical protein n=1 Tax=Aquimarina sp. ERC-38 TaxID=2949996 RepID=UPI0022473085|nr:hypothetical protein [Aquimarina sp. ERC-38]UZO80147.1 DUF4249 domain-containing protein [Aquimarina sp. ERC-38]